MTTRLSTIAAVLLSVLLVNTVHGGHTYTSNASGHWHAPGTWTGGPMGTYPEEDDRAIILCGHNVAVWNDESVDSIEIRGAGTGCGGGALTLHATHSLTIDHDNGPSGDNIIDGYINHYGDLKIVDTDQTIRGSSQGYGGIIAGYPNTSGPPSQIIIAEGKKLTLDDVSIIGTSTLKPDGTGTATFRNEGSVRAGTDNNSGTIVLESNLILEDTGNEHTYRWQASSLLGATLKFRRTATNLAGRVMAAGSHVGATVYEAVLVFEADVVTSGSFECNEDSRVDVAGGELTAYAGTELEFTIDADCDCVNCIPF